jgi:hypothetical protein
MVLIGNPENRANISDLLDIFHYRVSLSICKARRCAIIASSKVQVGLKARLRDADDAGKADFRR